MPAPLPPLASSFTATWRGVAPAEEEEEALEQALADLYARGLRAFPDVALAPTELAGYAGQRARPELAAPRAAEELRAEDLFLACACACGDPAALRALDRTLVARVPAYLRRLRVSSEIEEETHQALLERLFVPRAGQPAKIHQYSGRGELDAWLRVAALRTALNLVEAQRPRASAADEDLAIAGVANQGEDPELLFLKASFRGPFVAAFREALAALPLRDRGLLRLSFVDGVTPERIGKLHGVHRTTAMRWLDAARAAVLEGTRSRLMERLRLSPAECDGLFDLLKSRLDITLGSLLLKAS